MPDSGFVDLDADVVVVWVLLGIRGEVVAIAETDIDDQWGRPCESGFRFKRNLRVELYIVGGERDVIRVRTNYRTSPPEDVYLFRMMAPIENGRRIFLDYLRDINELREHPRFYNTLTTNCTT
ncbi:MAG: DUF4105 domain-containing protein, partial [Methylococcales bacterium]